MQLDKPNLTTEDAEKLTIEEVQDLYKNILIRIKQQFLKIFHLERYF